MNDITIMYITANLLPDHWFLYQIDTLLQAIGDTPIVSISKKPINLGTNIVETVDKERRYWAIYEAMYEAAKVATTDFVAQVEDDALYSREHFCQFRPPMDTVSYNRARWSLFAWEKNPIYCLRQRISNCTLIAPRKLLVEALGERFKKWPTGAPSAITGEIGRPLVDRHLGVKQRKMVEWYSTCPVIHLNHPQGIDEHQQKCHKAHGQIRAYDIPFWGKSIDIVRKYNGN
jgi:hypothetical protein